MSETLRKIEEKWKGYGAIERDVVKLARALDAFVHPPPDTDWQKVMDDGVRTLEEVADAE